MSSFRLFLINFHQSAIQYQPTFHTVLFVSMPQQEEGWPLGLHPLNGRVGLANNGDEYSGSLSFNTSHTASPCSSSSDLDTEDHSFMTRDQTDAKIDSHNAASLSHFLAVERRAADELRRSQSSFIYGPEDLDLDQSRREQNSLFVDGRIAPPQLSPWTGSDDEGRKLNHRKGCGVPVHFPCMC